jgi:phage terminase large subunit-like protein
MDNASNLAPTFLSTIVARYAGTRLGRQELDAELLDDVQGALWNGAMIERSRCTPADVPELQRVVVAIDPAVTSHLESDATGIVVVGLGADGHGYVLADCSGKFSPTEWAKEAVRLYHLHKADRIVAEVNNGGDLVEATIRMIDQNVSYKAVHASRGKLIRAEPVSALYEQNRVHHVGLFAELEDELCTFSPGSSTSPDRLDALVWGISDLLVSGVPGYGIIEFYRREAMAAGGSAGAPRDDSADVRLAAPEGISAVYMMSGRQCCVGPDGTVLASPEDAAPLMAAGWRMR